MGSVASDLKLEREKRSISLSQIAADTKISLHYLESLEAGRYQDLPGGIYNRAFLRAYCERLNLNQQEILRRYEAEMSPPLDRLPKSRIHAQPKHNTLKPNPVLIWSLMLAISATGLFFSRKWIAAVFSPYFSRKPAAIIARKIPDPTAPVSTKEPDLQKLSQDSAPKANIESAIDHSSDTSAVITSKAAVSVPTNQEQMESDSAAIPSQPLLRLEIETSEKCWISIDRDGSPAIRKLMDPGEIESFIAREQFFLIVGNAGGVHLKINGKPAKSLGKSGVVAKILINEKNLQDLLDQTPG